MCVGVCGCEVAALVEEEAVGEVLLEVCVCVCVCV